VSDLNATIHPIHPLLAQRESRRVIDIDKPLHISIVESLIEAARWAPSCANKQPWRMVVAQGASLSAVKEALAKGNDWAAQAPVIIAFASKPALACQITGRDYFPLDIGLAVENMLLQGTHLGLVMHPIAGFDEGKVKLALHVPEQYRIYNLVVAGFPGDPQLADDRTLEKEAQPRVRLPLAQVVSYGRWSFLEE